MCISWSWKSIWKLFDSWKLRHHIQHSNYYNKKPGSQYQCAYIHVTLCWIIMPMANLHLACYRCCFVKVHIDIYMHHIIYHCLEIIYMYNHFFYRCGSPVRWDIYLQKLIYNRKVINLIGGIIFLQEIL